MDMECIVDLMVRNLKEIGLEEKEMDRVIFRGKMVGSMLESIRMIRNMGLESMCGQV